MIAITLVLLLLGLLIFLMRSKTSSLEPSKQPPKYRGRFGESETTATIELRKNIEGTWRLVSYHIKAYGPITMHRYPLGIDASGYIMYTSSGYMSVQIMAGNRPQSKATNPHACTKSENTEAGSHYMAYCGTYAVGFGSEDQLLVKHSIEQSLFSNWIDSDQIRIAELTNDRLTLTTAELPTHYVSHMLALSTLRAWLRLNVNAGNGG